jgi:hypothetical protein
MVCAGYLSEAAGILCGSGDCDRRAEERPSKRKARRERSERLEPRRGREVRPEGFSSSGGRWRYRTLPYAAARSSGEEHGSLRLSTQRIGVSA